MGNAVAAGASLIAASLLVLAPYAFASWWDPYQFATESNLKVRTNCRGDSERWLRERFVIVDGLVYVRLGSGDASRVQCNGTAPVLGVEVAGQRFNRVRGVPAPEFATRVDQAMADKYPLTDVFVRILPHPLTMRLVPE
jgi:hypothetical protein